MLTVFDNVVDSVKLILSYLTLQLDSELSLVVHIHFYVMVVWIHVFFILAGFLLAFIRRDSEPFSAVCRILEDI